jgi:hypothetical protein
MRRSWITPRVEGLESRDMMSVIPILLAEEQNVPAIPSLAQLSAEAEGGGAVSGAASGSTSPAGVNNQFINPPADAVPTPRELKREQFSFKFTGKYQIGPPRFENQTMTIYFKGVGTSTYFLHGDDQVGFVVDKDPSIPASGNSTSYDRNNNTNAAFSFDLTGVPGAVNKQGLPTQFTISTDVNASAGFFDESTSSGLLTIHYLPGIQQRQGYKQGTATVTITGRAYTLGTVSNLGVLAIVNSTNPNKISF